jgi:hypothetical protein
MTDERRRQDDVVLSADGEVFDSGEDRICETMDEIGFHLFDLDAIPWATPGDDYEYEEVVGRLDVIPEGNARMKHLVQSDESKDRMPVSIASFPPHYAFPRHWHTHGELVVILKGSATFAGRELNVGDIAYNDSRSVYGSEEAGPDGVEFLVVRRAKSRVTVVGD